MIKARDRTRKSESGVSEVIGFMLILSLMVAGISLVTLYGYPVLLKEQASANVRNMEKNFIVIQTDVNSLAYRNVPYKETSLQVSGGTLYVKKDPDTTSGSFTISIPPGYNTTFYPGNLMFQSTDGQADVVLENGAVHINYWSDRNGSSMLANPRWYYDQNTRTLVIPLVRLSAYENMSQTGLGTVKMQLADTPSETEITNVTSFTITYHPDPQNNYWVAWKNYLSRPELGLVEDTSETYTFKKSEPVGTIIIKQYNVTVLSL